VYISRLTLTDLLMHDLLMLIDEGLSWVGVCGGGVRVFGGVWHFALCGCDRVARPFVADDEVEP
jgi:hypothetical protein